MRFKNHILKQNYSEMIREKWTIKLTYTGVCEERRGFKRALLYYEVISKLYTLKECTKDFQNSLIVF